MLRLFGRNFVRYIPSQIGIGLLSFLSIPIFTRLLSVEEYGQYALMLSSITLLVTLLIGMGLAIVRFYPAMAEPDVAVLVRTACWTQIGIGLALAFIALSTTRMLWGPGADLQYLVDIGIAILVLQIVFGTFTHVLRARLHGGLFSVFVLSNKIASVGLGIVLATYWELGVAGILWGTVLGMALTFPFLWKQVFQGISPLGRVSAPLLGELIRYGLPVGLGNIGAWVLNRSDRYLIQLFHGIQEVGLYSVAYSISLQSVAVLGVLFRISSGPLLTTVWEKHGEEATKRLLSSVTRVYVLVAIPLVVGISLLAKPIMQVLVGADFADAHVVVPWVVGGAFFLGLESWFNHVLLLFKRPRLILLSFMIIGLLNVGLNVWLLQWFSYKIAAVTTFISYLLLCVLEAYFSRRYFRWPFPWITIIRSVGAAMVMLLVLMILIRSVALSPVATLCLAIPSGMFIYTLCLLALGEISPAERHALGLQSRQWLALPWAR